MRRLIVIVAAFLVATTVVSGQCSKEAIVSGINGVTPFDIKDWAERLTSEEFRGRASGDIGFDRAAEWVSEHYKGLGLKPIGDNGSYFQNFNQPYNQVLEKGSLTGRYIIGGDTLTKEYGYLVDYFPTTLSASGSVTSDEIVYVNCGISAPELGFDAYKGVDVKGKIVICESGMPYKGSNEDTLKMWSPYLNSHVKVSTAAKKGAKAIFFVYAISSCAVSPGDDILAAYISPAAASDMLMGSGATLKELQKATKSGDFRTATAKNQVTITTSTKYHPDTKTCNVVSMIEGSDPKLKDEYIVVGAHLDHLGMMPEIFAGALDNASGVSITMGIAQAIKSSGLELKRSVVFINFGAEEIGLVGAEYFVNNMPFAAEKVKLMVNFDMLGKGRGFMLSGSYHAKEQIALFESEIDKWVHRPVESRSPDKWSYETYPRTDGGVFENEKIPTIYFGLIDGYKDIYYHHPLDNLSQLDYTIMCDAARAAAVSIIAEANR